LAALIIAIFATLAALASTIFAGVSLRMLARQTKSLSDQVRLQIKQTDALAKQTELQAGKYEILASSTELQFNLNVMVRLQEVLANIAEDDASRNEVWGDLPDGKRPRQAADALLDVIEMALKACERLPNFTSNEDDWHSYTEYVMANSSSLRVRALSNPEWWPEITPYANKARTQSAPSSDYNGTVTDAQIKAAKVLTDYDQAAARDSTEAVHKTAEATHMQRDVL
jgi:hypothetical protein